MTSEWAVARIGKLEAENERLRAEVESRRSQQNALEGCATIANSERDGALARIEEALAAIEPDRCIVDHMGRLMIWRDEVDAALTGKALQGGDDAE